MHDDFGVVVVDEVVIRFFRKTFFELCQIY